MVTRFLRPNVNGPRVFFSGASVEWLQRVRDSICTVSADEFAGYPAGQLRLQSITAEPRLSGFRGIIEFLEAPEDWNCCSPTELRGGKLIRYKLYREVSFNKLFPIARETCECG